MTHAIHDFGAKLRQEGLAPSLLAYVEWRRAVRRAAAEGRPAPEPPERAPLSINLDLTTACNYRCGHCIDWDILNGRARLVDADLRASVARMREQGLRSVILIGGGEPTLYPGFVDFVAFLKGELGLQVAIVSNGSRGDRLLEVAPLLTAGDWIRLSLDSGSNELFEAMHRPNDPRVTLDAICAWVPRLRDANPDLTVGFSYVVVWTGASRDDEALHENIHEIELAARRARDARFSYIGFKPVLERQADGAEVMDPSSTTDGTAAVVARIRAAVDRAKALETDDFSVLESINLRLLESGDWERATRQPRTCHMQALRQVLSPIGLYNCPAHRGVEKAGLGRADAWATEAGAREARGELAGLLERFDASRECAQVTCLYHGVNWWIEELVAREADPVLEVLPDTGDAFL